MTYQEKVQQIKDWLDELGYIGDKTDMKDIFKFLFRLYIIRVSIQREQIHPEKYIEHWKYHYWKVKDSQHNIIDHLYDELYNRCMED